MSIVEAAIGLLAPAQCIRCGLEGGTLCGACASAKIEPFGERCFRCLAISKMGRTCIDCRKTGTPNYVWVCSSYDDVVKEVMHKYKFGQQRIASSSIARLMLQSIDSFGLTQAISKSEYLVVPVPTATSRVRQRGFDHTALLARHISRGLNLKTYKLLGRLSQTRQLGADRATRLKQLNNDFVVRNYKLLVGRNILLVDDVTTTGATLIAATKFLRKAGARRVDAVVFAKQL